jgi:hypothetical protein
MPKKIEKWILFEYIGLELTPVSKPFKSKELAEKEQLKYSENIAGELGWVLFGNQSRCERASKKSI